MRLSELKALWETEREEYKRSEVGSGVQRFVWEMLKSEDFFSLSQGMKSTADNKRRVEFLLEERRKNGQPDAVIFMDAEVVIPVEVEKYEKARAGEWQILGYRNAFEKKYGILTDGFEWRFYYGEIADEQYITFTLDQMFSNPIRFRIFWEEYIKPANYYLAFFEKVGQQSFPFQDESKSVDKHRYRFFEDVTEIIRKLKDKLLNAGYFRTLHGKTEEEKNKKATEIAYSYLIQFILYKTLVDNGFPTFDKEFKKKAAAVHTNLRRGSYNEVLMILEGISDSISENIYKPFHQEQTLILTEVNQLVRSGEDNLISVAPFLDIFVLIKRYNFANVQNDIFGAIYENYLKELYDKQLGQYFTDPEVVNFMLEEIGYNAKEIKRRKHKDISIIDPSCGSGTFLYSAIREIVKAGNAQADTDARRVEADILGNVFGLDIAEFPLYLAEMSILMRMLPLILNEKYNNPVDNKLRLYMTEDSLSEFVKDVGNGIQGTLEWEYHGFMRDEHDLSEMKQSLTDSMDERSGKRCPRRRYDFVIGNPPYIGYNESSKSVGVKLFQMMKEGSVKLSNIYGWNLHSAPGRQKKYPPKPNLYAFFLSLGFALLKDNGRFCYIIPQTLLTEPDYDVVRHHLSHDYTIETLITFAGKLFVGRGTSQSKEVHTSSLILIATKSRPRADHVVECVRSVETGEDVRDVIANLRKNRRSLARSILQSELRENVDNWSFITWDVAHAKLYTQYKKHSESMMVYSEHRLARLRFDNKFFFDVGFILDREKESCQSGKDKWGLVNFKDFINFTNFRPTMFYPCSEEDIHLPKNSQGYEALYHRHKLLWEKSRRIKFYYTDADVVPSMSHCQIISSDCKDEIFFLFAVLNSSMTRRIFEAMFSLGNEKIGMFVVVSRLKDFVRPPLIDTPSKETAKKKIIDLVGKALALEERTMSEFVDFDTILHRVDDVRVSRRQLVLSHNGREISFPITRGSAELVDIALRAHFGEDYGLLPASRAISVRELKLLPVFDKETQTAILDKVDAMVLDLYGVG